MEDIEFRKLIPQDKDLIFRWISNPELRKMIGTKRIPNQSSHDRWFDNKLSDNGNETLIIEYNRQPIGLIGTNEINLFDKNAEMYLYLGEEKMRGKGIATKAISLFVKYLKEQYSLHKVTARIFSFNSPSIKVFEKCGFKLEGKMKEQIYLSETDSYFDLLWYGFWLESIK